MNREKVKKETIIFLMVSLLIVFAGMILMWKMFPLHINSNIAFGQDPAYQYLFAGIDILQGNAPHHNDHPGTPLQSLIAATIVIVWTIVKVIGLGTAGLYDSVLSHPEFYLKSVSITLITLTGIAIWFCGCKVYKVTNSYPLAISSQLSVLLFESVIPNYIYPTPEALLVSLTMALFGVMASVMFDDSTNIEKISKKAAAPVGFLCGIGVATKVTFMPILGLILMLKNPLNVIKAMICAVIAWFIGVLPIFERLPNMFSWFYKVLTHSGTHGSGEQSVFNIEQFKLSVSWIIGNFKYFYYAGVVLLTIIVLSLIFRIINKIFKEKKFEHIKKYEINIKIPLILLIIAITQTIMVAKHPGASYMIPALPITVMTGIWLINNLQAIKIREKIFKLISIIWLVTISFSASIAYSKAYSTLEKNHTKGLDSLNQIKEEIKKYDNPLIIGAFNCNFKECAEWFGMLMVPEMELRMKQITPNFYHFDVFNKRMHVPGEGEISEEQLIKLIKKMQIENRDILLISPEFEQIKKFRLEQIHGTSIQNLYKVLGLNENK